MASGEVVSRSDAITCFTHAYATCQAATLVFNRYVTGIEGIAEAHFVSFEPQNGICSISDVDDLRYGVPEEQVTQYPCADMRAQPDGGLVVSKCGAEGDVHIPAPTPTPTP